jgi:hypothetical protein
MGSRPVGTGPRFIGLALVDVRRLFVKAESSDRNGRQTRNRPRQSRTRRYRSAQAAIPREIRYARAVSVSQRINRELLIWTTEGREMLAEPERLADLRFVAPCGASRHAGHHEVYRELPCADAPLVRMGSDRSDRLD